MQYQRRMGIVACVAGVSLAIFVGAAEAGSKRYDGYKIIRVDASHSEESSSTATRVQGPLKSRCRGIGFPH